jgi:serine protease Do
VPGDVIVEIGQEAVTTAEEVKSRVAKLKSEDRRNALLMIANHAGALRYITVRID